MSVFEVLDHLVEDGPARMPRLIGLYERALALYQKREWTREREILDAALGQHPADALSKLYRTRCERFLEHPPADDWDGISDLEEK